MDFWSGYGSRVGSKVLKILRTGPQLGVTGLHASSHPDSGLVWMVFFVLSIGA